MPRLGFPLESAVPPQNKKRRDHSLSPATCWSVGKQKQSAKGWDDLRFNLSNLLHRGV